MKIQGYTRADYVDRFKYPDLHSYRATGRTTRLLLKCLIDVSARPEIPVVIVAFKLHYAKDLARKLIGLAKYIGIRLPDTIDVYSIKDWMLDKSKQRDPNNYIILKDHYTG